MTFTQDVLTFYIKMLTLQTETYFTRVIKFIRDTLRASA